MDRFFSRVRTKARMLDDEKQPVPELSMSFEDPTDFLKLISRRIPLNGLTARTIRAHLAGLEQAGAFEVEELRRAPIELKLRQIWSLMSSVDLLEEEAEREAGVTEVRERWRCIRQAFP